MKSAYVVLGIPLTASAEDIRNASRLLDEFHSNQQIANAPGSAERLREIRTAYHVLIDPGSRAAHDRKLHAMNDGVYEREHVRESMILKALLWAVVLLVAGVAAGVVLVHQSMPEPAASKQTVNPGVGANQR